LVQTEIVEQLGEEFAVFGEFDALWAGADDADAVFFEALLDEKNIPLGVGVAHGVKSVPPHAGEALRACKPQSAGGITFPPSFSSKTSWTFDGILNHQPGQSHLTPH
ncbi:MAG: hypothetical protein IAE77_03595, partial [Prosthecobacter sp.]|nr:hypothetical protein [Prosthecobacter sp.]